MGAIYLRDEVQLLVDGQVADGHAETAAAFLEEAVLRLIGDASAEEEDIAVAAAAGAADIEAGQFTVIDSIADGERLHARLMARLEENLAPRGA